MMEVLPKRFEKYGLTIHPDKTRLVPFERPSDRPQRSGTGEDSRGDIRPAGIHALLGTLSQGLLGGEAQDGEEPIQPRVGGHCGMVPRQPASTDGGTAPNTESEAAWPLRVLRDHGQRGALQGFRRGVIGIWRKWLGRRHRGGEVAWERMTRLLERYKLPPAVVVHSVYRQAANI